MYECNICHYWYFLEIKLKFPREVCNGCHDLIKKLSLNYVAVASVKGNGGRTHFWYMSKDEALNLLENADLTEKGGTL